MRITKFTHACLRIEHDGGVLVIDPGVFTEAEALDGADAVLITHEHFDHVDIEALRALKRPELTVHTHADVEAQLTDLDADVYAVAPGDTFVAAGMTVRAHGGRHAVIHADIPRIVNVGFVIDTPDGPLYHPGDAFHVPDEEIATLFVPVSGAVAEARRGDRLHPGGRARSGRSRCTTACWWTPASRWSPGT